MLDLTAGLILIVSLSVVACYCTVRLAPRLARRSRNLVALGTMAVGGLYLGLLWNSTVMSRLLPVSGLPIVANWLPLFGSILAALAFSGMDDRGVFRRSIPCVAIAGMCLASLAWPVLGSAPECGDRWIGRTCLQTTPVTCSAASAATLLRAHGIDATEQEMARLCLTRDSGTPWMGLYRGLTLKTEGTPWRVEIVTTDVDALRDSTAPASILIAELESEADDNSQLREACGWIPGQSHAVVFYGFATKKTLYMGDPTMGPELWLRSDLETLWSGIMVRLVPR